MPPNDEGHSLLPILNLTFFERMNFFLLSFVVMRNFLPMPLCSLIGTVYCIHDMRFNLYALQKAT